MTFLEKKYQGSILQEGLVLIINNQTMTRLKIQRLETEFTSPDSFLLPTTLLFPAIVPPTPTNLVYFYILKLIKFFLFSIIFLFFKIILTYLYQEYLNCPTSRLVRVFPHRFPLRNSLSSNMCGEGKSDEKEKGH